MSGQAERHRTETFTSTLPARTGELGVLRQALHQWLASLAVDRTTAEMIVLATSEASANAIEHAYGMSGHHTVRVVGRREAAGIHIAVTDTGGWRTPETAPSHRGRGIMIMRSMLDDVKIDGSDTGTTVHLYKRLPDE